MRVKTLIEKLQKMSPDARVKLHHKLGEEALFALAVVGDNETVWLESVGDIDLGEEISARLENAKKEGISKDQVYRDLDLIGVTPEMVANSMGVYFAKEMREALNGLEEIKSFD